MKRGARILYVDDDDKSCQLFLAIANRHLQGVEVETATSAEECLKLASEKDYDLVLVDLVMPNISGFELAEKLKTQHSDLPIVAVSTSPLTTKPEEFHERFVDYLLKPFSVEEVVGKIKKHL